MWRQMSSRCVQGPQCSRAQGAEQGEDGGEASRHGIVCGAYASILALFVWQRVKRRSRPPKGISRWLRMCNILILLLPWRIKQISFEARSGGD